MSEDQLADYAVGSPTRLALNVLAHKWTLLIVLALKRGPLRFTRLRSQVPGVTSQVLRDSLRELERDGIVVRQEFVAVPPHVEYSLTELGATPTPSCPSRSPPPNAPRAAVHRSTRSC